MSLVVRHMSIAAIVLVAALFLPPLLEHQREVPLRHPLSDLNYRLGQWTGEDREIAARIRAVLGTSDILLREYVSSTGTPVGLYVSYFPRQRHGEGSHSPKHCLPGSGWNPVGTRRIPYPLETTAGHPAINEIIYERAGERQVIHYWYRERERIVASEYMVKLYLMWDAVARGRTDGALMRVSAPVLESEESARNQSLAFIREAAPAIDRLLPN